jgi:hypothetical protein
MDDSQAPAAMLERISASLGSQGIDLGEPSPRSEVADNSVTETGEQSNVSDGLADFEWEGAALRLPKTAADVLAKAANLDKDYTQSKQKVAESQRQLEQLQALTQTQQAEMAFTQSVSAEHQEMSLIDQYLKQVQGIDWSKLSSDQMIRQKIELDQWRDRRASLAQTVNDKRAQFAQQIQARLQELRGKSRELVSKSIENFSEDTERTTREHAKSEGLTDREIDTWFMDPRIYRAFAASAQLKTIRATAASGKQPAPANDVLRPGTAGERMPKETAQKLNFRKAMGKADSSQQKATLIEQRLAGGLFKGHK